MTISPVPPLEEDEDEDDDDSEEDEDPKGRRFRAMTMSSKHALIAEELSVSFKSKLGSMSEYRNVTRPFKARPDASLTVIFESLPSGVTGSESTPLGEVISVEVR